MGSFNQSCIVTNTPIQPGDRVMVGFCLSNPNLVHSQGGARHDLLFGLPVEGVYDDYGEASIPQGTMQALESAWEAQTIFRPLGGATDSDVLWMVDDPQMMAQFLSEHKLAEKVEPLVEAIRQWAQQEEHGEHPKDEVFDVIFKVLHDPRQSAMVWDTVKQHLFTRSPLAECSTWMVHAGIYELLAQQHFELKHYSGSSYAAMLSGQLQEYLTSMDDDPSYQRMLNLLGGRDDDEAREMLRSSKQMAMMRQMRKAHMLEPITRTRYDWTRNDHYDIGLLSSYFMGGLSDQDVLDNFGSQAVLNYVAFCSSLWGYHVSLNIKTVGHQESKAKEWAQVWEVLQQIPHMQIGNDHGLDMD